MNIKRELIAVLVRYLAENTNLVRKPDPIDIWLSSFLGVETYDKRIAAVVEEEAAKAAEAAKRFNTNRKFNKIMKHI